jgi:hypothetical protein
VNLGAEKKRKQTLVAAVVGVVLLLLIVAYEILPSSSTNASTNLPVIAPGLATPSSPARSASRRGSALAKKDRTPQSLDPTLHLAQLASTERIKYEGSGRNIFVAQAEDVKIPTPLAPGRTDSTKERTYTPPPVAAAAPIPLKFFGFASHPGEPKKIFLSKGDDVFIAGEGEIVDRRYKVVRITPTSVEIQDVVGSGPPQSIPLTQG